MRNAQIAPPGYVLPRRPGWQGGWNFKAVCGAAVVFMLTASASTEWLAMTLGNPIEMGEPLFWFRGVGAFQPFAGIRLWSRYAASRLISSEVRRDIWIAFAATIFFGLFLAWIAYWFLSLIRDRKDTDSLQNLHGSAKWADRQAIKELGLLDATDGVYIGGWRDPNTQELRYLIHSGSRARPSLQSLPSRSGKGVSAIVGPSLVPVAPERCCLRSQRRKLGPDRRVSRQDWPACTQVRAYVARGELLLQPSFRDSRWEN